MMRASLSIDLDNKWSYLKTHGDDSWKGFPSYLPAVVPHVLELAADLHVRLTIFVVGQDAELPVNHETLARLGETEHEIGNHSFHHEPWLHLKSHHEIDEEIKRAHSAIMTATGRTPTGFRGPGFSISVPTIRVLAALGYEYDASTLPTFIGPLARAFYFRGTDLSDEESVQRSLLFGRFRDGIRPNRAYVWSLDGGVGLVEVPVTTMPLIRTPIHATYLLYLARLSPSLARAYLRMALRLCRLTGVVPSLLLHSLDFVGGDEVSDLAFFPGMDMNGAEKRSHVREYVSLLASEHRVGTVEEHVRSLALESLSLQELSSLT